MFAIRETTREGRDPVEAMPTERLEAEICSLSGDLAAGEARLLRLVAELDRRLVWAQWGCKSCAHWLSINCGLGMVAAREKVRVANALVDLPLIADALERGELSYCKVRAVTRVATSDTEDALLYLAREASGSQLERIVRSYRGALEREVPADEPPDAYLDWHWDDDGMLVIHGRLAPEDGALLLEAHQLLSDQQRKADRAARASEGAQESAPHDSAESRDSTDDSAESSPQPKPTAGRRRAESLIAMVETLLANGPTGLDGDDRHLVHIHTDTDTLRDGTGERGEIDRGPALSFDALRRLACDCSTIRITTRDGTPLDLDRRRRTPNRAMRRALRARDGGCVFPGCDEHRNVHAHHIVHWADGGSTKLANLVSLCWFHHRLVHEGKWTIEITPGGRRRFHAPDGRIVETASQPPTTRHPLESSTANPKARSGGGPFDLGLTLDAIVCRDSRFN